MKERKELKYPHNGDDAFDWRTPFVAAVANAKYIEKDHSIKFIVEDINVMNEARHYIETKGWFDEYSLNRKLMCLNLDCFVEICDNDLSLGDAFTDDIKKAIKENIDGSDELSEFLNEFGKDGLKTFLMSASKEAIIGVLKLLPFGNLIGTGVDFLIKVLEKA